MKLLICYFSYSGNTEKIAKDLQKKTGADLFQIERETPYSKDYNTCAYVEAKNEIDKHLRPALKQPLPDISGYDKIIVAFPIWWYTSPMVILTFLESYDWQGKTVYLFANSYTDDPRYMENSLRDAKESAPTASIQRGLFNKEIQGVDEWIRKEL